MDAILKFFTTVCAALAAVILAIFAFVLFTNTHVEASFGEDPGQQAPANFAERPSDNGRPASPRRPPSTGGQGRTLSAEYVERTYGDLRPVGQRGCEIGESTSRADGRDTCVGNIFIRQRTDPQTGEIQRMHCDLANDGVTVREETCQIQP